MQRALNLDRKTDGDARGPDLFAQVPGFDGAAVVCVGVVVLFVALDSAVLVEQIVSAIDVVDGAAKGVQMREVGVEVEKDLRIWKNNRDRGAKWNKFCAPGVSQPSATVAGICQSSDDDDDFQSG